MVKPVSGTDSAAAQLASGAAWQRFCETLDASRQLVLNDAVSSSSRDRAEGFRYLTRLLAAGINVCIEHADPEHPEFGRMMDHTMKWGLDAPDCLYLYASVRSGAAYRIYGNRGGANHLDIQVNYGHFASGDIASWGTLASINGLDLALDADGGFELFLGGEPRETNWLDLGENAEFVLVRQYFDDWDRERPADLYIVRLGDCGPRPAPASHEMAARLERLCEWLTRGAGLWEQMSQGLLAAPANTLNIHLPQNSDQRAGMRGQAYGLGNFHCTAEQAVVVEFTPPSCRHWSFSLANEFWESLDFATRQTSLNRHQARLSSDGVFRAVIAHRDPGVANWLDTAGLGRGSLVARFLLADAAPTPRLRQLPFEALASELPADTPRVSAEERSAILARRRQAVWQRFRR